ncbi:hypothetical protein ACS5PJ_21405 [Pseudarthrobacter sp. YS3]|uniref:hypothetical protein n=1 Tax=Pseudarthrobacter sp. YS3 TaxID=3453718 RepID=UPI003EE82A1A
MSDRIDHHDDSPGALFDSLIARESGTARSLVPRLPTMFEAAPAGDALEPAADVEVVAPFRPARPGYAAPPVAGAGPWPDRSALSRGDEEPVQHRHEVVRVERQVLVEAGKPRKSGDQDGDNRGASRPRPAAPDIPREHERLRSPEDGAPLWPRRAVRPPDEGPALRHLATELVVPAPEGPANQADRHQGGPPVVVTRREVLVPRPEQPRATPDLPRPAEPVVRVSIGRLEIRAVPDPAPARTSRRERRTQSLDDYLEQRNQGSRS